ncbi:transcriptional regulator [Mesoflavibacter profundi]|uniref:Transcriptional regulator n=1 Tax=Mesoflavibacter profundi TaxID=2708110 RepID=A0ABT4S140_9FLAO|nr:transcriptional regulator [Mesoflavibacter profundi]MDA0177767.1 transcriptional regulator [Mesoflavibacter profundi]
MKFKTIISILFAFTINIVQAQYTPYFENYSLSKYNAGNQNWGISVATNGKVYVANNKGLLVFNGLNWKLHTLPNKTTIRSVLAVKDRIYTGSYEEFGYWKYNSKGELLYTSLTSENTKFSASEEFWQILNLDQKIIFRSFQNVYILEDETITRIRPQSTVITCNIIKDQLYISTLNSGVYKLLKSKQLIPVINDNELKNTKIVSVSAYKDKLLITTALKGCFFYDNEKLTPANFNINDDLKRYQLNSFSALNNGNLVFGTIKNGVFITNNSGQLLYNLNKENGLANNTILNTIVSQDTNIWLCLDNGLSKIDLSNNISYYNDVTGKLGAVYDVLTHQNTIYIGSNTGLYYLDNDNKLNFIDGTQGQVWDLKIIDNQLFCGHNDGTFIIDGTSASLISNYTGGWTIKKVPEKNIYIQGTYAGLVKFSKNNSNWTSSHLGKTTDPIRFLEFEDKQNIWAANAYKGLSKIKLNTNLDSIVTVNNYINKGLQSDYNIKVYKIKNNICFKTNNGWKKYEPLQDSIVSYKFLNSKIGENSDLISATNLNDLFFKNETGIIKLDQQNNIRQILTRNYYDNRVIVGYENISKLNDSTYALNLNDGFLLFNANKLLNNYTPKVPTIEQIKVNNVKVNLDSSMVQIPNNGKVHINIASPLSKNHYFEYSLDTDNNKWEKVDNETLILSNLKNGDFYVAFRTTNKAGESSKPNLLKLHVLPPWYKSSTGFLLYLLAALMLTMLFYLLHKRKIKKEQRILQIQHKKEQQQILKEKNIENERKLVELKNEALENEIKLKSKQLANTAIALVKKNEALLEIKKDLQVNEGQFSNKLINKRLQKKIDQTIGNKDQWEIFEYNFNQVHEKFFNQLKDKHPKLSHKDLKLSAYIKMNLTTKEIAPLMNISTRGVETHRYRLKQRLDLSKEDSLTDYLNSFN